MRTKINIRTILYVLFLLATNSLTLKLSTNKTTSQTTSTSKLESKLASALTSRSLCLKNKSTSPVKGDARIFFTVQNELIDFQHNDESLVCHIIESFTDFTKVKKLCLDLQVNDKITIFGRSYSNPEDVEYTKNVGIIATIILNGKAYDTNTKDWICNEVKPKSNGKNFSNDSRIQAIADIGHEAEWIWASEPYNGDIVACSFTYTAEIANSSFSTEGSIYFSVDNIVNYVKVNGKELDLSKIDILNWPTVKELKTDLLPGDIIEINGSNEDGPKAIIATIKYRNTKGEVIRVSTNKEWSCGGEQATELEMKRDTTTWISLNDSHGSEIIDDNAYWIWGDYEKNKLSCQVKLTDKSPTSGRIAFTLDSNVSYLKVNGIALEKELSTQPLDDWTIAKLVEIKLKPGDIIEISGDKGNKEFGGFLATIDYPNKKGQIIKINSSRYWVCNDKQALESRLKYNSELWTSLHKTYNESFIDKYAFWIWDEEGVQDVKCSITLPEIEADLLNRGLGKILFMSNAPKYTISINNTPLDLSNKPFYNEFYKLKSVTTELRSGDNIEIELSNIHDPFSYYWLGQVFLFLVEYSGEDGHMYYTSTDINWTCDNEAQFLVEPIDHFSFVQWYINYNDLYYNVFEDATWIALPTYGPENIIKCQFRLPSESTKKVEYYKDRTTAKKFPKKILHNNVVSTSNTGTIAFSGTHYSNQLKIKVNDTEQDLSQIEFLKNPHIVKFIHTSLSPGDTIEIKREYVEGEDYYYYWYHWYWFNGFIATIYYKGSDGTDLTLSTSKYWSCNNKPAYGIYRESDYYYSSNFSRYSYLIDKSAYWIQDYSGVQDFSCKIVLPDSDRNLEINHRYGQIGYSADNQIKSIRINGETLDLSHKSEQSLSRADLYKIVKTPLFAGDTIEIEAMSNNESSSGILSTIQYIDSYGLFNSIQSDSSWNCDGQSANERMDFYSKQSYSYYEWMDNYDSTWIWGDSKSSSTTCSITLPDSSSKSIKNGAIFFSEWLSYIKINGLYLSDRDIYSYYWGWGWWFWNGNPYIHHVAANLNHGDVVELGLNYEYQFGLLSSIQFEDDKSNIIEIFSDSNWICNGKNAIELESKGEHDFQLDPNYINHTIETISDDAYFIKSEVSGFITNSDEFLISCKIQLKNPNDNTPVDTKKLKISTIAFTVDDIVNYIKVNDKEIDLSGLSKRSTEAKQVTTYLAPGDVVEINGTNKNGHGGILASIYYENSEGLPLEINTNKYWECDGNKAVQQESEASQDYWKYLKRESHWDMIDYKAFWIWGDRNKLTMSCKVTLPEQNFEEFYASGYISLTVKNSLEEILVNGYSFDLNDLWGKEYWSAIKFFYYPFLPGDEIEIRGSSYEETKGIIAEIHYYDTKGTYFRIGTDAKWICDGDTQEIEQYGINSIFSINDFYYNNYFSFGSYWIWGDATQSKMSCKVVLPGSEVVTDAFLKNK